MGIVVLVLSDAAEDVRELLPSWPIAPYDVRNLPLKGTDTKNLISIHPDIVLIDATVDVGTAEQTTRRLSLAWEIGLPPLIVVLNDETISTYRLESGADDFLVAGAAVEEISARLSMAARRAGHGDETTVLKVGDLIVNPENYQVYVRGRPLDLTYKEFELLKFLAQRPGRVCDRELLLQEVWGYDYYGGTRTVDVHVRRLRAKLGAEHEALIETIRNVGYRLVPRPRER